MSTEIIHSLFVVEQRLCVPCGYKDGKIYHSLWQMIRVFKNKSNADRFLKSLPAIRHYEYQLATYKRVENVE